MVAGTRMVSGVIFRWAKLSICCGVRPIAPAFTGSSYVAVQICRRAVSGWPFGVKYRVLLTGRSCSLPVFGLMKSKTVSQCPSALSALIRSGIAW